MTDTSPAFRGFFRGHLAAWCTPALVLLTPFVSFLKFQEYPLLSLEVLYLALLMAGIALIVGALIRFGGKLGTTAGITAVAIVFADFQFEIRITYLAIGAIVLLILGWFAGRPLVPVLAVVSGVVFLSTLILPPQLTKQTVTWASEETLDAKLNPILHIILDEHLGVEGFENRSSGETRTRELLKSFYVSNGFRLFGGAYSNFDETFNSLPNMLNNSLSDRNWEYIGTGSDGFSTITRNAYLVSLSRQGYGIRVYQSLYFNFCETPDVRLLSCISYNYTGLGNLDALTDNASVRASLVLARYLNRSRLYGLARSYYQELAARGLFNLRRIENNNFAPLASYPFFEVLAREIAQNPNGQVFFAHLLIPHRPFMFDSRCAIVLDQPYDNLERMSDPWLSAYREAYHEQVACTTRQLGNLFAAMKKAGSFDRTTIVVHGDHGSRIQPARRHPNRNLADIRSRYSTLLAVKAPNLAPGYDNRLYPIRHLLHAIAQPDGAGGIPDPDSHHTIFLRKKDSEILEKYDLPDFRLKPKASRG